MTDGAGTDWLPFDRKRLLKLLSLALSLSLISIIVLILLTRTDGLISVFSIKPCYLLLALLSHIAAYFMWALRIRTLCKGIGYNLRFSRCVSIVFNSLFLSTITPSMAGGEPVRIHILARSGVPYGTAAAEVFSGRLLDIIFLLLLAPFSIMLLIKMNAINVMYALIVTEFFLVVIVALIFHSIKSPSNIALRITSFTYWLRRAIGHILRRKIEWTFLPHMAEKIEEEMFLFKVGLKQMLQGGFFYTLPAFIQTSLYWLLQYSVVVWLIVGLTAINPLDIIVYAVAIQLPLTVVLALPLTPGSSGFAEFGAFTLFSYIAPYPLLGVLVLAWRLVHYYFDLIVGGIVNFVYLRKAANTEELTN
ncbi:MAG: lysylphosphatidylglycerol synthase transmembrane domain-containing protein [Methermicoccaceae archaeon]